MTCFYNMLFVWCLGKEAEELSGCFINISIVNYNSGRLVFISNNK